MLLAVSQCHSVTMTQVGSGQADTETDTRALSVTSRELDLAPWSDQQQIFRQMITKLSFRTVRLLSLSPRSWDTSRWWRPSRWWRTPWWPPPPPPPWRRSTSSWPPSLCRRRSCPTLRMKAVSEGSLHWVQGPTLPTDMEISIFFGFLVSFPNK